MPLFTPGAGGGRGEQQDPLQRILTLQLELQERQLKLQERQQSSEVMFKST